MKEFSRLTKTFIPTHYDLSLTLERVARVFHGVVTITGQFNGGDYLPLHAKDLEIASVLFDGKPADVTTSDHDELHVSHADLTPGEHILVVSFKGQITDAMHGLYPCYFETEGEKHELLATQFESHHAREVFPCVDEPAAKATFDLTLTTEEGVDVIGNMPIDWQRSEPEGLVTKFQTTPKMSSYLLAWVVGNLQKKTATTKSGVEVNVWSTAAHPADSLDFALENSVRVIEFYNDYFGIDYPLPKCDHVALPDFSSGAMENWGLITYRESTLLAGKHTGISARRFIALVIAHELSHQWFGNLVTMEWWDDLWLNESFANMMEYIAIDALYPEWHIWREFSAQESVMALRRDALDGVQSVHVDVAHPDEITTLFDGAIVYAKGAKLMRMLQQYIGNGAFQRGLQSYFKTHAYQNTTGQDLWNELSTASGKDISLLMNTWISQPGFPVVSVTPHGNQTLLEQTQFFIGPHKPRDARWPIPLNATEAAVPSLLERESFTVDAPASFRLNDEDTAHFITRYTPAHLAQIVSKITDGSASEITRLQILHEQTLLAKAGMISAAELLPLLTAYQHEQSEPVWNIIGMAIAEIRRIIEGDDASETRLKSFVASLARPQFERLGWDDQPGEDENDTLLRANTISLLLYAEEPSVLAEAKKRFDASALEDLHTELRSSILSAMIKHHDSDGALASELLKRYGKENDGDLQQDICIGLTSTRRADTTEALLHAMKQSQVIRPQDVYRWFAYLIRAKHSRTQTWKWLQANWGWVEAQFGGDKSMDYFPRYAANALRTPEELKEYQRFFDPLKENQSLTRAITIGEGEIKGRLEQIERDKPLVDSALKSVPETLAAHSS